VPDNHIPIKKLSLPNDVSHVKRAKTAISLCLMDGQQHHMATSLAEEPYSSGQQQTWHNSLTVLRSEVASEPTDYSPMRTIKSSTFSNEDDLVQSSPICIVAYATANACAAAHGLSAELMSVSLSVSLFVCLLNQWTVTKRNNLLPKFLYHSLYTIIRFLYCLVLWQEEWLVRTTPSTWNFGPNWPRSFKNVDFLSIFARSTLIAMPSEKKFHYH